MKISKLWLCVFFKLAFVGEEEPDVEKRLKLVLLVKGILIILRVVGVLRGSRQLAGQCAASFHWPQRVVWGGGKESDKLKKVRGGPALRMPDRKPWKPGFILLVFCLFI